MAAKQLSADSAILPKGRIGSLRSLLAYLRAYRLAVFGALVALVFTSTTLIGMGTALKHLIDQGIAKGNPTLLDSAYFAVLAAVILLAVATYARYFLVSYVGERVVADIRRDVYGKLMGMHLGFFETTRTGELLSRLTTDTTLLQTVVGSSISIFLRNTLLLVGGSIMLAITSMKLTSYVSLILPLVLVPILVLGRRVRRLSRDAQARVGDLSAHAEETLGAIRTVQALSLEEAQQQRFMSEVLRARNTAVRRIRMRALLTAIVITLVLGAIVTVLWIGGRDVVSGRITPGDLSAFIFYSVLVAGSLAAVSEVIGELQRAGGAAERLMELMALTADIQAPPMPIAFDAAPEGLIAFNDVTFRYPARPDTEALAQFSLSITPGERIALVGPSGAGKTTVLQLLLRFYDPQEGTITIDGVDLRRREPKELRAHIGLVPQDAVIFSASAADNIRAGKLDATMDELRKAAGAANILDFIESLPQGFETFLGEKGVRLSGGQRQRLAIARALVRDPRILLLDEATSALDSQSEQLVQQALERVMQGRTTLVIAHRLSTILRANRIVVMDEGRIEAIGTHAELLKASPLYARLAALQFGLEAA